VVRRDAVINRTEDLMSKSAKKRSHQPAQTKAAAAKPSPLAIPDPPSPEERRAGLEESRVIAMLQSPAGATIAAMMKATGWQQHSVRGFLAGVVRKRLKLKLGSKKVDGIRGYQIAGDDGVKSGPHRFRHRPA
jgi:Protein of unknown function (DUF3489)